MKVEEIKLSPEFQFPPGLEEQPVQYWSTAKGAEHIKAYHNLADDISKLRTINGLFDFEEALHLWSAIQSSGRVYPEALMVALARLEPLFKLHGRNLVYLTSQLLEEEENWYEAIREGKDKPTGEYQSPPGYPQDDTQEELDALVNWEMAKPNPYYIPLASKYEAR